MNNYLPIPTEEELKLGGKAHYYDRCYNHIWENNIKVSDDYATYIHIFYSAYILEDKTLNINEIKKRMKNG